MANKRVPIPVVTRRQVLMEAGYRCAVPTCRTILAIDLHHIIKVEEDGSNDADNLIALCGVCHDLYHRGEITKDAIRNWKGMLIFLNYAFDNESINNLLFLYTLKSNQLLISGDGVLKFSQIISSGMASFNLIVQNGPLLLYNVQLTDKGRMLIDAWFKGDRTAIQQALEAGRN